MTGGKVPSPEALFKTAFERLQARGKPLSNKNVLSELLSMMSELGISEASL